MISQVYVWANGMVMVFDETGQQVCELQGPFAKCAEAISARIDKNTEMFMARWAGEKIPIPDKASFDRLWRKE